MAKSKKEEKKAAPKKSEAKKATAAPAKAEKPTKKKSKRKEPYKYGKREFAQMLAVKIKEKVGYAELLIDHFLETVTDVMRQGDTVQFIGFGQFSGAFKEEHTARNPATGGSVTVPDRLLPKFSFSGTMKTSINEAEEATEEKPVKAEKEEKKGKKAKPEPEEDDADDEEEAADEDADDEDVDDE